jgi:hypothetical protein
VSDQVPDDEAPPDDPLRDKLEALLRAEALEPIARALGKSTERPNLEALREWLREDFYSFYMSCTADRKWAHERAKRHKAASALLLSLQSELLVGDMPRVWLDEPFREKFMRVLETLARPRRTRHRRLDAFRQVLVPGLIWVYEHITRNRAKTPNWSEPRHAYTGAFYDFACAVRECLYNHLPEARAALPSTNGALAQELEDHWPEDSSLSAFRPPLDRRPRRRRNSRSAAEHP